MERLSSRALHEGRNKTKFDFETSAVLSASSHMNGVSSSTTGDRQWSKLSADSIVDESDLISDSSFYDLPHMAKEPFQSSALLLSELTHSKGNLPQYPSSQDNSKQLNRSGKPALVDSRTTNQHARPYHTSSRRMNGTGKMNGTQERVVQSPGRYNGGVMTTGRERFYYSNGHMFAEDSTLETDAMASSIYRNGITRPAQPSHGADESSHLYSSTADTESTCSSGIAADIENSPRSGNRAYSRLANGGHTKYNHKETNHTSGRRAPVKGTRVQSNVSFLNNGAPLISNGNTFSHSKHSGYKPDYWAASRETHPLTPPTRDTNVYFDYPDTNYGQHLRNVEAMSVLNETQAVFGSLGSPPKYTNESKTINGRKYSDKYAKSGQHMPVTGDLNKGHLPYEDLSLMNSFSVESSRRISSAVWAMKLLDAEHTLSTDSYQQMLLKARIFRRWHQRVRLRRLIRMEVDSKMNSAVTYWQLSTLSKYFTAWRQYRLRQQQAADQLHRQHMLQMGVRGLRFVAQFNTQVRQDAFTCLNGRLMAKYWLKWQSQLKTRQAERLKTAFNRWRVFKLEGNRDKILEGMSRKHLLSRNYSKWKLRYHVEQSTSVAGLHFKVSLLTKCWHAWRVYSAQRVVKWRLSEVARVHYEDHVQARLFYRWVEQTKKSTAASTLLKRKMVFKAFYYWKNWTEYAKVLHQRFQSMCKEYYNRALVKQSFVKWKQKLLARQADGFHRTFVQRRVYRLWFLRFRRKVIHRHLCKAMAKKGKRRRFFRLWLDATRSQQERRHVLVTTLQRILLSNMLNRWREFTTTRKSLRECTTALVQRNDGRVVRKAMDKWMFAMKVVNFTKMARIRWSERCVRRARDEWKLLVRRKHLEQTLIDNRPERHRWILLAAFARWIKTYREETAVHQRARSAAAILARNTKRRVLQAWRVMNQQEQIIAPMVARRRRKHIAWVFDAWRLHIHRQKYVVDQHSRSKEHILIKHFVFWRGRTWLVLKERDAVERLQQSKMCRVFSAWKGHVRECRHERLKERAKRLQLMEKYYKRWVTRTEERAEARAIQLGQRARQVVLMRWAFKLWRQTVVWQRQRLAHAEMQVSADHHRTVVASAFRVWLRWHHVTQMARDHAVARRRQLLQRAFQAWLQFIKDELQKQVQSFTTALALDSSYNLGASFRSTLGSTLGSSLGSSSELFSSGYGTGRIRRGSGSVFPFPSPRLSQRDDDVASLPGRMDHVEISRITSPITVLRGSSHPKSPLAAQSPLAAASPCNSPRPELHLELPNDSVFTPVRVDHSPPKYDDTLPGGISYSGSDEEYDHQSMTSSMSMRDREMVLTDTILHWRSLPLSLTFRSWLKFTRQQKLLRELLYYVRDKRRSESKAKALRTWRRELYVKVAARQHLRDGTRLRCLRAWHGYVQTSRMKEERNLTAQQQCHTRLLRMCFCYWKNKYTAKKRLQSIVGLWQKNAIVDDKHKSICDKVQARHERRVLRERFLYWARLTRKSHEAKAFYLETLLPRFFVAWHSFISTRVSDRRKACALRERTLTRTVFIEWQQRFMAVRKTEQFLKVKETSHCLEILRTWHHWANGISTRRAQWRSYRRSLEVKTMRDIFTAWLSGAQQLQNTRRMYDQSVMRRVFLAWRAAAHARVQHQSTAQEFRVQLSQNLLSRCFKFWRRLYSIRKLAVAHAAERDLTAMRECYREWRDFTLEQRAEKHHVGNVIRKVYFSWYDNCLARKKARCLIKSWKTITEDSKTLNSKAMEACQQSERKLLHRAFTLWVQQAHKIEKAKTHSRLTAMRCALLAWHHHVDTRVRCARLLVEHKEAYQGDLLSKSFLVWRESFRSNVRNLELLEDHLAKKEQEVLVSCMQSWKRFTLKCRAAKHCNGRLVDKCFWLWKERLEQKRGMEQIMQRVFTRRTRQTAFRWRQFTSRAKQQEDEATRFHDQLLQLCLQRFFVYWKHATEQSQRAKRQHGKLLLARCVETWRTTIKAKIEERRKINELKNEVMQRKIARMFKDWAIALKAAQKNDQLVSGQLEKHHRLVLGGAMLQWKKFIRQSRADKHYGTVLTARFFLEWKVVYDDKVEQKKQDLEQGQVADRHYRLRLCKMCFRSWMYDVRVERHLEMKQQQLVQKHFSTWAKKCKLRAIAGELGDHRLYAKYWNKWRHQLVRKRVSELMMKHEEKKLLSEVFGAWFRLTTIRQRLLKEWNTAMVEKWFRLWMQKYNDS